MAAHGRVAKDINFMPNSNGVSAEEFGALKANVENIGSEVHGLRQSIGALHAKLDEKGKPPYALVGALLGLLTFIGIFVLFGFSAYINGVRDQQNTTLASMKEGFDRSDTRADKFAVAVESQVAEINRKLVPRDELNDRRDVSGERTKQIEANIRDLQSGMVSRGEHEQRWRTFETTDASLQAQLDKTNDRVTAIAPPANVLQKLDDRLSRLEMQFIRPMAGAPAPP